MYVRDVMSTNPVCCSPDTAIAECARMMVAQDCGEIPVCDERGKPIGVVTDRDIVARMVAKDRNPINATVHDCMSAPVVTATPDMEIDDCVRLMEQYRVRRLPVVDADGRCCGMVAQADLARKAPHETTIEVVEKVSEPTVAAGGA